MERPGTFDRPHRAGDDGVLAALAHATTWLNSRPLTAGSLRGHVVLVDFWTYTCVNWLRTLPYRRAWLEKYDGHGLVLIGVHTPEFGFEHDLGNVRRAVQGLGVEHPVAVDNDYDIWTAFDNHYWPALYFIDIHGQVRHHHFGEGEYAQSERMIQQLLTETGASGFSDEIVQLDPTGVEAAADWNNLRSPENYLGSARTENFASPAASIHGASQMYVAPPGLPLNHWALVGDWTVTPQAVVLNQSGGTITYRFHARDLNLVMTPATPDDRVPFHLSLDGRPPGAAHGSDTDAEGNGLLDQPRLYQLIRQPTPVTTHTFDITFHHPGAQAHAFTFG